MSNSTTMERVFITDWIMETAQKIDTMIFGVRFSTLAKLAIDEAKAQKKKSRQKPYSFFVCLAHISYKRKKVKYN